MIFEAIENPILQRFLEIDTRFNPRYDYDEIDIDKSSSDENSDNDEKFLEMDKYMRARFKHVMKKEIGPNMLGI